MKKLKHFFLFQFPAIFWMTAIFIQSSISKLHVPDMGFKLQDKFAHAVEYAILAFLLLRAFENLKCAKVRNRYLYYSLFVGVFYGILDEIHQYFVPGRSADIFDVAADILGVVCVVIIKTLLEWKKRSSAKK